ncbi:MAG: hypothetical protein WCC04_05520 [Terriglobales bacterium]
MASKNMASKRQPWLSYSIDAVAWVVSWRVDGTLTFSKIVNYASSLCADPRFSPAFSEIVDLRLVKSVHLNAREAMILADKVDPFSLKSKRAFVAQSEAQIHVAHLHRILRAESKTIRVFFSVDEARRWIECGEDTYVATAGV